MSTNTDRKLFDTAEAQVFENKDNIKGLQADVDELDEEVTQALELMEQADSGPVKTIGPVIDVSRHGFQGDRSGGDIVEFFRQHPNSTFVLPMGEYSVQSMLEFIEVGQEYQELQVIGGPHARLVVEDEDVDAFAKLGNKEGGAFSKLSLRNLTLVVDPDQGYDAGWGRFYVDDELRNVNLSIEGQRDYYGSDSPGDKFGYFACMTTPSGIGIQRNLDLPDGDTAGGGQQEHAIGVGVESEHVGTHLWIGCYLENWWDNGYYVKDGIGQNIMIGCEARNCGGANIRIGHSDVVIGCRSVWDDDRGSDEIQEGICFGADDASATTVHGLQIRKETGENDVVRLWSETSEQITISGLNIVNETGQYSVAFRGTGDATAELNSPRIVESADENAKGAAIEVDRFNVVLKDPMVNCSDAAGDRDTIDLKTGRVDVRGGSLAGAAGHCIRVQDGAGRLLVRDTQLLGGIYHYPGSSVGAVQVLDVDARKVDTMWPEAHPSDVSDHTVVRDVLGDVDDYPRPTISDSGSSGSGGGSGRSCSWIQAEGIQTPVFELEGEGSGPMVAIVGGVHGDEDPGFRVAGRLASMHPQSGTLRIIPRANPDAIESRSRNSGYDLNRVWPRSSSPSTELAGEIWKHVRNADVLIDLHRSTGIYPSGAGQAVYSSTGGEKKGQQACVQFNARYVDPGRFGQEYKFSHVPGQSDGSGIASLVRYAASKGMNAHLVETTTKGVAMERPVEWLEAIVHELLWQYDVHVE